MEKQFSIYLKIDDETAKYHYLLLLDTVANTADVCYLDNSLLTTGDDEDIVRLFSKAPDYHLNIKSEALAIIVDELGGITCNGQQLDGKAALKTAREGRLDKMLDAIGEKLNASHKLVFMLPSLISSIKDLYESDLHIMEAIKTAIGEIPDFPKWKANIVTDISKLTNKQSNSL